jgi:hypothetical protein
MEFLPEILPLVPSVIPGCAPCAQTRNLEELAELQIPGSTLRIAPE